MKLQRQNKWTMKSNKSILIVVVSIALMLIGCSSRPSYVIKPEKMARLLVDIHIGESMVDINRSNFATDSMKKVVEQSILMKHGVTQEQVDTSFVWYGHNIEEYIKVYDRVIEILEDEIEKTGSTMAMNVQPSSIAGDSIDIWQDANQMTITSKSPMQFITFAFENDENWEKGDIYKWRVKAINNRAPLTWGIAADYADGSTDYLSSNTVNEGWNDISIITDSTKNASRIYGYINVNPADNDYIYFDSISLVRTRLDLKTYRKRSNQKTFNYSKKD